MASPLFLAAAGPQSQNVSMFDPASPPAESIRNLAILGLAITGFIFVVVEGVLIYCIIRFRRRSTPSLAPAAGERGGGEGEAPREPPQVYGSKSIEIAWTAAPALIVGVLFLVTARTLWEVNPDLPPPKADDHALYVTVIGRQWWWEYTYDHYNGEELFASNGGDTKVKLVAANELHVPAGGKVYLTLKTADVCHSFWVPRLAGKTDLIPGRTNYMWFETKEARLYVGQCAEYCGSQHANMLLRVEVQEPDAFEKWLTDQKKAAKPDRDLDDARKTFLYQSCVECHRVRGTTAQGKYGPDLTHLMSRKTLAGGMIANDDDGKNLAAWVDNPWKIKPSCRMPPFGLTGRDREQVLRYLRSLE
jgi:cytochrome c oxidase subunit 2